MINSSGAVGSAFCDSWNGDTGGNDGEQQHAQEFQNQEVVSRSSILSSSIVGACLKQFTSKDRVPMHCANTKSEQPRFDHRRILLQGPPKSGKSSLAMDVAFSIASQEPCRCFSLGRDLLTSATMDRNQNHACHYCTAVTYIVPAFVDRAFPLLCEPVSVDTDQHVKDCLDEKCFLPKKHRSIKERKQQRETEISLASRRIHVRHVTSVHDVMQYLLSVTGLPVESQPLGGIIMDDIDVLCSRQDVATSAIRMSQIAALLLDTVLTISKVHNFSTDKRPEPLVLMTASDENIMLKSISSFWSPLNLHIQPSNASSNQAVSNVNANKKQHSMQNYNAMAEGGESDDIVLSGWSVWKERVAVESAESSKIDAMMDYVVVQNHDRHARILWADHCKDKT